MEEASSIQKIESQIYDVFSIGKVLDIKFSVGLQKDKKTKGISSNNLMIFYLDKSGSMSGTPIKLAKEAMISMIETLQPTHEFIILPFDGSCGLIDLRGCGLSAKRAEVDRIQGSGGTAFVPTFKRTREVLEKIEGTNTQLYMIFLTDGQAEGKATVMTQLRDLLTFVQTKTQNAQIHCLGFSAGHDAPLLGDMAKSLGSEGTFQYIPDSNSIKEKMENLYQFVTSSRMRLDLNEKKSNFKAKLVCQECPLDPETENIKPWPENALIQKARLILPGSVPIDGSFEIEAEIEGTLTKKLFSPEDCSAKVEGDFKMNLMFDFITHQLIASTNRIMDKDCSKEEGEKIKADFERANGQLDELRDSAQKIKGRARRKDILRKFSDVKNSISSFYGFYRKHLEKSVTNEDVAKMYDIAYRGAIKKGLQKQIDKRAEGNTAKFQEFFTQITKNVEALKPKIPEIRSKQADLLKKIGVCFFSTCDPIELLEDEDCLSICLSVTRSEAAIADSSRVRIRSIFPSKMGAATFQDAYESALEEKDAIDVNGGFKHRSGAVVKGTAGEEINAVMPLYLFEENWKVASYWMKMSLGLLTTLDPLGYSFDQLITIPFLVLEKAYKDLKEKENEHTQLVYDLVLETCIHLFQDVSRPSLDQKFNETLKVKYEEYLGSPAARTTDVVSSNPLFISQLFVAQTCGEVGKFSGANWKTFYQGIFEEECRRSTFVENYSFNVDELLRIVGESEAKWISQHVEKYKGERLAKGKDSLAETARIKYKGAIGEQSKEEKKEASGTEAVEAKPKEAEECGFNDPSKWTPKMKGDEKGLVDLAEKLQANLEKFIAYNLGMLNALADPSEKPLSLKSLSEMGLDTPEKMAAFLVQAASQAKNADRRDAITNGKYADPFNQEEAVKFLKNAFALMVAEKKRSLISGVDKELDGNKSAKFAHLFATSNDIEVATGSIIGAQLGVDVTTFFKAVLSSEVHDLEKKLDLLFGHFPNIRTYKDKNGKWVPSRQRCFQIYCKFRKHLSDEKWKELFIKIGNEKAAKSIESWNKRSAKSFKE